MHLVETNCYNCNSPEFLLYDKENGYNLVKCKSCGLLYVNPRPADDQITAAHKTGIHRGDNELDMTNPFNEAIIPWYLNVLADFYSPDELANKTWLDIGCGNGNSLSPCINLPGIGLLQKALNQMS